MRPALFCPLSSGTRLSGIRERDGKAPFLSAQTHRRPDPSIADDLFFMSGLVRSICLFDNIHIKEARNRVTRGEKRKMRGIFRSLNRINMRLYAALLLMGLVPALYTTVRTNLLGQLPGDWAYSIAGQLSWVGLIYEILDEAIILPLFYCLGAPDDEASEFSNRVRSGLAVSGLIYAVFAVLIIIFIKPLLAFMAAEPAITDLSAQYIRIESVANVFGIMYRFLCVAVVAAGLPGYVYAITALRLVLSVVLDTFLVSSLPFSLGLGVNGIGYSNILINAVLAAAAWLLLKKGGLLAPRGRLSFAWLKSAAKTGAVSGLESFVRNLAYMMMVSRMVNMVGEQGTYWVANNFIWGWMLLPVLQLGELIKRETAEDERNVRRNAPAYFALTTAIVILWIVTIPLYRPFMAGALGYDDTEKLFGLVMLLFVPYIAYAYQNIFDAVFYGRGRTDCMLLESVITNTVYYGGLFIAYLWGMWTPSLTGIALMFGIGNIFDAAVSGLVFMRFWKKLGGAAA